MKTIPSLICLIIMLALQANYAHAQINFRTVAPQDPVVAGESFEIQFVLEGEEKTESFTPPPFHGFRLVTGPHVYKGSVIDLQTSKPLVNTVYTLAAIAPGKYFIPGAKILTNGSALNSNDVFIRVISKEEAFKVNKRKDGSFYRNSEYFLQPGEDPIEKIRRNLFMKVVVSKKICYVGEPLVATYKLYSRLESKSDIIKNPGFYGFAVMDMVNLADHAQSIETINGQAFDVHTVRSVQLYPLQAGRYTIDPMEVSNKVEFSRSQVNKSTEQEIVEGLTAGNNTAFNNNTEVYESSLKTEALPVTVKPLPAKNKTDSFTAAVGNFSIHAELAKMEIRKNEPGNLVISVTGKGNFTQINAPEIKWPPGIDGFEPEVKDSIDRLQVPLAGTKTFTYRFVSNKPGHYDLAPIEFNFFNLDTNRFEKLTTQPLTIQVNFQEMAREKITRAIIAVKKFPVYAWLISLALIGGITGFLMARNNKHKKRKSPAGIQDPLTQSPSIDEILLAPQMALAMDDRHYYTTLNHSIWTYFTNKTALSGSGISKTALQYYLIGAGLAKDLIGQLMNVMEQTEAGMYTTALLTTDREHLLAITRRLLKEIDQQLA